MIRLTDVSKYYRSNQNVILGLHKINLEFHPGELPLLPERAEVENHTAECHQWK